MRISFQRRLAPWAEKHLSVVGFAPSSPASCGLQSVSSETYESARGGASLAGASQDYPRHAELMTDHLPTAVRSAMVRKGLKPQLPSQGHGPLTLDEFSFVMDEMPVGCTPEHVISEMALDPNGTVNNKGFDRYTKFHRRDNGEVKPGDHYKIDMGGTPLIGEFLPEYADRALQPEDGDVVVRDISPHKFTLLTVENPGSLSGKHPLYGNRQIGVERLEDGGFKFYTRAAYRRRSFCGRDNGEIIAHFGSQAQKESWRAMLKGLSEELVRRGGTMRPDSLSEFVRNGVS